MSTPTECAKNAGASDIWAFIVVVIILMVIYGYVASKIKARKKRKLREATIPHISENLKTGIKYNVILSDGNNFKNVEIIGSVEGEDAEFTFTNWEGMLVLKNENNKKIFVKKTSVRFIEEI